MKSETPATSSLYGRYEGWEDDERRRRQGQDKLALRLAHKALDIPIAPETEDMIHVDNRRYGLGFREVAVILAASGIAAGSYFALRETPPPSIPEKPATTDTDTQYRLDFSE